MDNYSEIIKKTIIELLEVMNFEAEINIDSSDQQNIVVNIQTNEAGCLIGQAGANLQALQYLVRVLVGKKIASLHQEQTNPIQFIIDVNDYRKHRADLLRELAQDMAKQALSEKTPLLLQPMPAYERRIIHLTLANHSQITTESINQGTERRVAIKPK